MKTLSTSGMQERKAVAGIILAGGASRRMGEAKATLPWGDKTLLEHIIQAVTPCINPLIVVGSEEIALPKQSLQVQVVNDTIAHQGPLIGFLNGLEIVPQDRPVFLTGCHFPFVQPSIVQFLLDRIGRADAIVMQSQGRVQPFVALYQPRIRSKLSQLVEQGKRNLLSLFDCIDTSVVAETDWQHLDPSGMILTNINTPDDYEKAKRHYLKITSSPEYS